jgi:hypothetical protein
MKVELHGQSPGHHTRRPSGATSRPNAGAFIHGHPAGGGTAAGVKGIENDLLLCCAASNTVALKADRIKKLIQRDIDWPYILRTARRHGLIPLVYQNFKEMHPEDMPEGIMVSLHDEFWKISISNLLLTSEMVKLLDLFQSNGITAIPYKGPILGLQAYGDVCLRQFCDLDFLIHKHNFIKAKELLRSQGYEPEYRLSPAEESIYLRNECEYHFCSVNRKVLVELHWDIVQKYFSCHFDVNKLWGDLKPVSLLNRQVMTISPEQLLLILCLHHGGKHQWELLGWICDIAQLIGVRKDLDWETILDNAFRFGIERILFLGVYLAKSMLGADIPSEINRRLMIDPAISSLAEKVRKRIFTETEGLPGEAERFVFDLRMRENVRDKMEYCFRRLFTSTKADWSLLRLPAALFPLYRFLRPFRLVKKFGRQALGLG